MGVMPRKDARMLGESLRAVHKKIVFTNGVFDIIHRGHVQYLMDARALGDVLVVGLNCDSSVKRLKGETRPVVSESDRAFVLSNLKPVDYVVIFEEDTPLELISEILPDVLVKGGDWAVDKIVGGDVVRARGGIVKNISFVDSYSTTGIIERIEKSARK
ncbi:MAG TPA: D-glycero-beta-D-manno-heptose 1-phosphate adenylyltransferase [Candidatus Kapabacteria bacterium]|nr:D-glycero-beta-D-manno-heptose 1-phosphate adenylyltransferase [Candidatus Kapabacteria bacterium]